MWLQLADDVYEEPASNLKRGKEKYSNKTYLWARLQTSSIEKKKASRLQSRRVIEIYYFHPRVRAPATSPQHKSCLFLPVVKCGFSFGHVKLKTSYRKNCSEFATSARCFDWTIRTLLLHVLRLDLRGHYMRCKSFPMTREVKHPLLDVRGVFVQVFTQCQGNFTSHILYRQVENLKEEPE